MEILFIGVACTEEALIDSNKKYYNGDQVRPQQHFDMTLTTGLSEFANVTAVSMPPVAAYPNSSCLFYKRRNENVNQSFLINYISLINLPIIKTLIIMVSILMFTIKFCFNKPREERAILMGNISSYTSFPAMLIAKFTKTKIYATVPDVPKFIVSYTRIKNPVKKFLTKGLTFFDKLIEYRFDGYIFLTKAMNKLINKKKKPYIVMEGMIKEKDFVSTIKFDKHSSNIIMYAGTLHIKFGIKKLVDAFNLINLNNTELWVFGQGDFEEKLREITKENHRIKYFGSIERSKIIENEHKATILVNPRPISEEFTKYSFPSKTLEYMASGTPLLTTKLSGIPEEYYDYVFTFRTEDINEMADDLRRILSLPRETLNDFGNEAKRFVLKEKNNITQAEKIYHFLILNTN